MTTPLPQDQRDKKAIDQGFLEARKHISSASFDDARRTLSRIAPPIRRLNYRVYDLAVIEGILAIKERRFAEARPHVQTATRLKPDDVLPWKMFIQIDSELGISTNLCNTIKRALQTAKPDVGLLQAIAPHVKPLNDDVLTEEFIRIINAIPDGYAHNFSKFLPETPRTLDIRLKMMREAAPKDTEVCSDLIDVIISECQSPFEALKWAEILPVEHQSRLYAETLMGDHPIESAKRHLATGSARFREFLHAVENGDLDRLKNEVCLIPAFPAGWAYLADETKDLAKRIQVLDDALQRFPQEVRLLKRLADAREQLGDVDGAIQAIRDIRASDAQIGSAMLVRLLIRQRRASEALKLLETDATVSVSVLERAVIDMEIYRQDGDTARLKRIIALPDDPALAGIKVDAAWELRDELGSECETLFANALKLDRTNGRAYLMFGKWELSSRQDLAKGTYLLEKAVEFGAIDADAFEIVSRKAIEAGDLEKALRLCVQVDTEWSHFRAGLIYQRNGSHELAVPELHADLRYHPQRIESWSALGYSYMILGRVMAARSVADELRSLGSPDLALEYQIATFCGRPIVHDSSFDIEREPRAFLSYLTQLIDKMRQFAKVGRFETCRQLGKNTASYIDQFADRWGDLSSVLKVCGDFQCEMFGVTCEPAHSLKAIQLYKRRAELDRRAEAFIDLAHALQLHGRHEDSVTVLRRVLKVFSDHPGIWTSLGIAFALTSRFPFARHCLCVGAKLATDSEAARSYACCAAVGLLIDDQELLASATNAARRFNPYDQDVWQLLARGEDVAALEAALIAFEFGSSPKLAKHIVELCLKLSKPLEALGYAFMSGDRELLALCLEAQGRVESALLYAETEESKRRLSMIVDRTCDGPFALYDRKLLGDAAQAFMASPDVFSQIAAAVCLMVDGKTLEGRAVLEQVRVDAAFYALSIDKLLFRFSTDEPIRSRFSGKDASILFLELLQKHGKLDAARLCLKRFPSDPKSIEIYVYECLNNGSYDDITDALLTKARGLVAMQPSQRSLTLFVIALIRSRIWKEAIRNLQTLCVLAPGVIPIAKPLLAELTKLVT